MMEHIREKGSQMSFNLKGAFLFALFAWPWFLGTYLAVQFGAANPSLARTITGWVFEAPWVAFLAFIAFYAIAERSAARKRSKAQAARNTDTSITDVRCWVCQHVQTVPIGQEAVSCEQCNAHLTRRPAAKRRLPPQGFSR
jgi:ribosomal protein S27E